MVQIKIAFQNRVVVRTTLDKQNTLKCDWIYTIEIELRTVICLLNFTIMLLTAQNVLVRPVHVLRSASTFEMEWSKGHNSDSEVVVQLYHHPDLAYW